MVEKPIGAGKRKAVGRSRARGSIVPGLPSAPVLVGATAVVVAAAGAVSVGQDTAPLLTSHNIQRFSGQASVLGGASSIGSTDPLSVRQVAVSRDSARQAQEDAADQRLQQQVDRLSTERQAGLRQLAVKTEKYAALVAKNAWQVPIAAGAYHLTSRFGDCSGLWSHCHTGLDFAGSTGSPVHAIANGVVTSVGYDGAYGNKTVVQLEDGTEIWYCHQNSVLVSLGDTVVGGEVIGSLGSTGNTTGPHLHIEVRPGAGDPVDPYAALVAHGVTP